LTKKLLMDLSYVGQNPIAARPKTLVCYICGREYGTRSLEIHIKTCEKKWDIQQKKLPKKIEKALPTGTKRILKHDQDGTRKETKS